MKIVILKLSLLSISMLLFTGFAKDVKTENKIIWDEELKNDCSGKIAASPILMKESVIMTSCERVNQLAPETSVLDSGINGLCLGCSVTGEANLLDADLTNFASINVAAGVAGSGFITLQLSETFPAGTRAGFLIEDGGGVLSLFNGATLTSSLGGIVQQVLSGGSLINVLGLGGPDVQRIETIFCEPFDELTIELGGFAGGAANYKIYYGYVDEGCQFPVPCGSPPSPEICGDGIDNDGDSLLDSEDPECQNAPGGVFDNLIHWAKADGEVFSDAGTTTAIDGGNVSQWNDASSGFGTAGAYDVSAAVGLEPVYLDGTAVTNFNPSLDFDGDNMTNPNQVIVQGTDITMFAVGLTDVTTGLHSIYALGDNANDPAMNLNGAMISPTIDGSTPTSTDLFTNQIPVEKPMIWSLRGENEATTADDLTFAYQGEEVAANGMDVPNAPEFGDGIDVGGLTNSWDGHIMEVITYNRKLTAEEMQLVHSYLAIKYGITLSTTDNDGAITEGDYVAADGTVIWNSVVNATYHNNVAGIAVDSVNQLIQKQAIGMEDNSVVEGCDALVTIALGNIIAAHNGANAADFASDNNYLLWGNNDLDTTFTTAYAPNSFTPTDDFFRMPRAWKVQETGTLGNVTIGIPASRLAEYLLVSTTDNFVPLTTTEVPLIDDGNGNRIATIDLTDGQFFTFGRNVPDKDEDMDGVSVNDGDPDDMDACVPDNTAGPCCEAQSPTVTKD